jgi:hypothetical protein
MYYYTASFWISSDFRVSLHMQRIMPPDIIYDPLYRTHPRCEIHENAAKASVGSSDRLMATWFIARWATSVFLCSVGFLKFVWVFLLPHSLFFTHSCLLQVITEWFVNYFGGKILRTIKREAPNGNRYDVRVTENINRKILKFGWTEFVDASQVKESYSLMLRYLGFRKHPVLGYDIWFQWYRKSLVLCWDGNFLWC